MRYSYQPKTIMITGATAGFGYAMANLFARELDNVRLILTGRRLNRLQALQNQLPCDVHILNQDITDTDQVLQDIENLPPEFLEIDCLINNAGLAFGFEGFTTLSRDEIDQMIDVNIKGMTHTTRAVLPIMQARKRGHIINLGSVAGTYPYPGGHVYCGAKAFINHFSKALRADVKGQNIRVTSIEPGAVESEFSFVRFKGDAEKAQKIYEGYRKMTSEDMARTILWVMTQPESVNINALEVMPTDQSFNGFSFSSVE